MRPILVIQMQRMGDLILSFPLLLWLRRQFPGHPIWVLADPLFATPLHSISPEVRYLTSPNQITNERFTLVINLSHRLESLNLAGQMDTEALIGGYRRQNVTRVAGTWQEYRQSLTHNNHLNRFHWADLNALDVIQPDAMVATQWPLPRIMPSSVRHVGLFLGASDPGKRPAATFWAGLIQELEVRGLIPILLGGQNEMSLCQEVRALAGRPVASACGQLRLDQLALFGQNLAALVTPDTGPMHLAAWSGLRVLNLSLGPVHAWETGPYQPGHLVLRPSRACAGCWRCRFDTPRCHEPFTPTRIARVLELMLRGTPKQLAGLRLPGMHLDISARSHGLYDLTNLSHPSPAQTLGRYWRAFWTHVFGRCAAGESQAAATLLREEREALVRSLRTASARFFRLVATTAQVPDWRATLPALRPLSGYAATHLENHDCSVASRKRVLELIETHLSFLDKSG